MGTQSRNRQARRGERVRLQILNDALDAYVGRTQGAVDQVVTDLTRNRFKVSCKRGCSHCCYQWIGANLADGMLIARHMHANGMYTPKLVRRLWHTGMAMSRHTPEEWMARRQPCVFLNDGECDIYPMRPTACRAYFVVSPPERCHIDNPNAEVAAVNTGVCLAISEYEQTRMLKELELHFSLAPAPLPTMVVLGATFMGRGVEAIRSLMRPLSKKGQFAHVQPIEEPEKRGAEWALQMLVLGYKEHEVAQILGPECAQNAAAELAKLADASPNEAGGELPAGTGVE